MRTHRPDAHSSGVQSAVEEVKRDASPVARKKAAPRERERRRRRIRPMSREWEVAMGGAGDSLRGESGESAVEEVVARGM